MIQLQASRFRCSLKWLLAAWWIAPAVSISTSTECSVGRHFSRSSAALPFTPRAAIPKVEVFFSVVWGRYHCTCSRYCYPSDPAPFFEKTIRPPLIDGADFVRMRRPPMTGSVGGFLLFYLCLCISLSVTCSFNYCGLYNSQYPGACLEIILAVGFCINFRNVLWISSKALIF